LSFEVDADADVECEDDVDVDADSFVVGLGLAAWAMAVPPPMSAPDTVSATSALRSCRRMITSFRSVRIQSRCLV